VWVRHGFFCDLAVLRFRWFCFMLGATTGLRRVVSRHNKSFVPNPLRSINQKPVRHGRVGTTLVLGSGKSVWVFSSLVIASAAATFIAACVSRVRFVVCRLRTRRFGKFTFAARTGPAISQNAWRRLSLRLQEPRRRIGLPHQSVACFVVASVQLALTWLRHYRQA
jgi:hypothetical protein